MHSCVINRNVYESDDKMVGFSFIDENIYSGLQ